jgi:hypothetical protein
MYQRRSQPAEAIAEFGQAIALQKRLVDDSPLVPSIVQDRKQLDLLFARQENYRESRHEKDS